jgi:protein-S-isoprenylcysteine O-methyltransferase Ste14
VSDLAERPNNIPWPPLVYAGAAAMAVALHFLWPLPWIGGGAGFAVSELGLAMIASAVLIDVLAVRAFRAHKTTIMPHRGASALITSGPFAYSRNPIYVGNTLLVAGAGLLFGVAWLIAAALVAAAIVQKLAIQREERHFAAKFGTDWQAYAARTPRWIGF